jgi:hypothetical protein
MKEVKLPNISSDLKVLSSDIDSTIRRKDMFRSENVVANFYGAICIYAVFILTLHPPEMHL